MGDNQALENIEQMPPRILITQRLCYTFIYNKMKKHVIVLIYFAMVKCFDVKIGIKSVKQYGF